MAKRFGSPVHPELNNPDVHWSAEIVRRDFPTTQPATGPFTLSAQAGTEVQAFADMMGVPVERIVNDAILYWFDMEGANTILREEKIQEWLSADPRRTRAGYFRKASREFAAKAS